MSPVKSAAALPKVNEAVATPDVNSWPPPIPTTSPPRRHAVQNNSAQEHQIGSDMRYPMGKKLPEAGLHSAEVSVSSRMRGSCVKTFNAAGGSGDAGNGADVRASRYAEVNVGKLQKQQQRKWREEELEKKQHDVITSQRHNDATKIQTQNGGDAAGNQPRYTNESCASSMTSSVGENGDDVTFDEQLVDDVRRKEYGGRSAANGAVRENSKRRGLRDDDVMKQQQQQRRCRLCF